MEALNRFDRALGRIEFALVGLLMCAMVVLVVVAVVMRYVFGAPLIFSYDLSTLLFAWTVFVGLALAERADAHLAVNVIDHMVQPRPRQAIRALRKLLVIAVSVAFAWYGWKLYQRAGGMIPSMRISIRWLYASLPAGFALLVIAQISGLLRILFVSDEQP